MALTKFKIQGIKAVDLAQCDAVPKVMVIAGANGAGKSTLLHQLSQRVGVELSGNTKFLYQPPHRAIRRQSVQRRWLGQGVSSLSDVLSQASVSGFEGLNITFPSRSPDNVDETGSTIKFVLGRIENRRQALYAELVDKARSNNEKTMDISKLPDIYQPLKKLTEYLLPHITFDRVDFHDDNNIKCVFNRTVNGRKVELDLDDLSSGEKSIIILFLPLIENDIHKFLQNIKRDPAQGNEALVVQEDRVLIADEPELHLHPDLQAKILTYIRNLSTESNIQFIMATHSPTILDQALDNELYMLSPQNGNEENQLKKIASSLDKLEALKELAGNTYLLTTGRRIVCLEGNRSSSTSPTDIRILEILYPRSTAYTFIPSGGKGNVINQVQQLREHLPEDYYKIKIFGLTDMDQTTTTVDGIYNLPVCMIENLLLDEESLLKYFNANGIDSLTDVEAVKNELNTIITEMIPDEIGFRVMRKLHAHTVRIKGETVDAVKTSLEDEIVKVRQLLPTDATLAEVVQKAKEEVEQIVNEDKAKMLFRGKEILKKLYDKFVSSKNIPYPKFCYELAQIIAQTNKIGELLNPIFDNIDR